jgi:Ca-activated chloride channel family protein
VAAYRLIGYENRLLKAEDFNDDRKDAGEIGAGHTVTALYEIVPSGVPIDLPSVDALKYQAAPAPAGGGDELATVKLRYKEPDGDTSRLLSMVVQDAGAAQASSDLRFASAVVEFGMLLRDSEHRGDATFDQAVELARGAQGQDPSGLRAEFVELVRTAQQLANGRNLAQTR